MKKLILMMIFLSFLSIVWGEEYNLDNLAIYNSTPSDAILFNISKIDGKYIINFSYWGRLNYNYTNTHNTDTVYLYINNHKIFEHSGDYITSKKSVNYSIDITSYIHIGKNNLTLKSNHLLKGNSAHIDNIIIYSVKNIKKAPMPYNAYIISIILIISIITYLKK